MLTLKGIPVIYSGDEIGMLNDYDYHNDPKKWADSRYIHRGDFRWDMAEQRNDETSVTGILFHEITRLSKIKKENEVFHSDAHLYCFDTGDRRVLGVKREYNGETLLGLFNFSEEHCRTEIESADWHDLTEPDRNYIRGESKTTEYWIEPYGFRWFVK
jgi:amylosucrase